MLTDEAAVKCVLPTRRAAVLGGLACSTAALSGQPAIANFTRELEPALRSHAHKSGIRFGCAGAAPSVQRDGIMLEKIATEANIFIPEGCLKWEFTEPRPGEFYFEETDSLADFARRHDMLMQGHTLVWYAAIPPWVTALGSARDARRALERHIEKVVSHYRGKVWAWDVVNEPIEPKDDLDHSYRNSIWQRLLGIDHVDLAFRLARGADALTPLSINEYGFEYADATSRRRREAMLALLRLLRERNTPVDCLGLQSHLDAHKTFDRAGLTAFLREVVGLGYRLMITELDVNDVEIPGNEAERDAVVDRHVATYLDIVFSVVRPLSVSTWGLSDRYTWLPMYYKRSDGKPLRPLPLDRDYNRKRMWSTLARFVAG
jgi:endo-1,4-beta-xylanase